MHRLPRALVLRHTHPLLRRPITRAPRRLHSQVLYTPSGDPVRYQAVRFLRGPFSLRRAITLGLYVGAFYVYASLVWRYLDVQIEIELEDEEKLKDGQREGREVVEEEEEEEQHEGPYYAEEDSTFIPLTWSHKLPREWYKGSDPEWQEFVRMAKDKDRHKKIQNELVSIVFTGCAQHPAIARQLGKEPKVGKYWLDISFPDGPPQEYQRSGIEIGDGFIAWSQQKVSPEKQWRTMRALWPQAAAEGAWATMKVLTGIQYRRAKQALGWEGKDPFSPEERFRHAMEMMQKQQAAREKKRVGGAQTEPGGRPDAATTTVSTRDASSAQQQTPLPAAAQSKPADSSKKQPWTLPAVPIPAVTPSHPTDLPIALHVFNSTLSKSWNPKRAEPPRGTFVVTGLVEVKGARGRMLFDVQSCYDPKAAKYVAVNAAVRGFKRWQQGPRGGA